MDEALRRLDNSALTAQKHGNWAQYMSLQEHKRILESRKTRVDDYAKEYIGGLVKNVLSEWRFLNSATVLDSSAVYYSQPSQDFTDTIIDRLRNVTPVMPELPKIVVVDKYSGNKTTSPAEKSQSPKQKQAN